LNPAPALRHYRAVRTLIVALLLAGCSDDPPSCQQAAGHYYAAGCAWFTSTGPVSEGQFALTCQQTEAAAPADCLDEFDAWLFCLDGVKDAGNCDCSREQSAILACR